MSAHPIDQLVRSNRRTLGIEINAEAKLIVRAPKSLSLEKIQSFIFEKHQWITFHQEKLRQRQLLKSQQQLPTFLDRKQWLNRYRYLAYTIIQERCTDIARQHGLIFKQIKISSAKGRWGSCSPQGNLNFNWKLILAPLFVIDYLIVHELAHLVVKDHSKRFWAKVASMDPQYLKAEHWLKHNGYSLDI